ncbi:hypothetical protein A374_05006 [Fictibacillus macauensis ZFHKF-1]|uniref:Hydrolase n=1 Tax=Fictibacillus macauensis ZFHKF-1 TaxID=1196324 RepID=I8UHA8_9BACL|nr:hypothetical protein [Fictibacillus macauensis]EIT86295.1 hypothetical protein A374_05006 [Fictibacillus macauensis ZFHKF-1]
MEKTTYYVNVESGEIHTDSSVASFQFEICATEDEAHELAKLFQACDEAAMGTFWRSHVPYVSYHNDQENDQYDQCLKHVYQFIHDHGQPLTKSHIASMGILNDNKLP